MEDREKKTDRERNFMANMDVSKLAEEIIAGKRLGKEDDLSFFIDCDLEELKAGADKIRKAICGDKVDLCTIINGRSGRCGEDCKYCAQSAHYHTTCEEYEFLDEDTIVNMARSNQEEGVDRFSIVTSGKALTGEKFDKAIHAFERMHRELKLDLCASMGFLTREQLVRLKEAGVTGYHDNIETSRRNFPNICTTHTFEGKLETIRTAQEVGIDVCSGGIIGMGETWEDRIDMALTLAELKVCSIPINVLMPIKGTPLENQEPLSHDDILRTMALFRYICPDANIRLAGGRMTLPEDGKEAFSAGASATITGNMLTTSGSTIQSDKEMLTALGRDVTPDWNSSPAPKKD